MSTEGSIWRKWDLHIHTPASFLWRGERFQGRREEQIEGACRTTVAAINGSDAAAFAVMHYWTFDGYLRLRRFLLPGTRIPPARESPASALQGRGSARAGEGG